MHRVVITGLGAITSVGNTAEESWQSLLAGKSGVGPITLFDASRLNTSIAAEIKGFDASDFLNRRDARRWDRFEHIAQVATIQALGDSGLEITEENSTRIGAIIASGVGGLNSIEEQVGILHAEGPRRLSPFAIPRIMTNGAAGTVSIMQGVRGPSFCITSACAGGADGIGVAFQFVRQGIVDAMITGGSEAAITEFGIGSFERIQAYSSNSDNVPAPFSRNRDGLIMGEGVGMLIIETLEHARKRGANIIAELAGYGASADAYHITAPTEDGSGSAVAVRNALHDAQINPDDIDYINAHGTGTPLNDAAETKAVKAALGDAAYNIPMSSTKSMTGHCMGSTGAMEAVFCSQAIRDQRIPPTINYQEPDPECDLDYVPNEARDVAVKTVISNSFGFGGHNSVLVIKAFEG